MSISDILRALRSAPDDECRAVVRGVDAAQPDAESSVGTHEAERALEILSRRDDLCDEVTAWLAELVARRGSDEQRSRLVRSENEFALTRLVNEIVSEERSDERLAEVARLAPLLVSSAAPTFRVLGMELVSASGDRSLEDEVLGCIDDPDALVRMVAVYAADDLGMDDDVIRRALTDPEDAVRVNALEVLIERGEEPWTALLSSLSSESYLAIIRAIGAIARLVPDAERAAALAAIGPLREHRLVSIRERAERAHRELSAA